METGADINGMLMKLGFTQLESEIYLYLLMHGPSTGYAIAKGIDKAVANVYKGVNMLAQKGALEQTSGRSKLCSATPWQYLLDRERIAHAANITELSEALKTLPKPQNDEQVYQVKNADTLKQHAIQMISEARSIILADLEPSVLIWIKQPLIEAAARGVEVRAKVYADCDLQGVILTKRINGEEIFAKTADVQLGLCVDGTEMLKALFSTDCRSVIQAFHSKSALMVLTLYNQLLYELVLTDLKRVIPDGNLEAAQKILSDTEHLHAFSNRNIAFENFNKKYMPYRD